MCPVCSLKPCFSDGKGGYFITCGKTCAIVLKNNPNTQPSAQSSAPTTPTKSNAPMCPVCNLKPCFSDGKGGYFDTCGKTCSVNFTPSPKKNPTPICPVCNLKPCHSDGKGGFFDTCGKTCATNFKQTPKSTNAPLSPMCPVCFKNACHSDGKGGFFDTCGKTCAAKYATVPKVPKCQMCQIKPCFTDGKGGYYKTCGKTCASKLDSSPNSPLKNSKSSIGVVPLDPKSPKYSELKNQFESKWLKTTNINDIASICEITVSQSVKDKYLKYRDAMDDKLKKNNIKSFKSFAGPGNELRRFHGCTQTCLLGMPKGTSNICRNGSNGCNVCGIIENGFLISKSGKNFGWLRFGNGVYLSATSGKSNDYNNDTLKHNNYKT
jgi:hypothetical protein